MTVVVVFDEPKVIQRGGSDDGNTCSIGERSLSSSVVVRV